MSSIFRKTFNLKNVNQFKFFSKSVKQDSNITRLKNPSLFDAASSQKNKTRISFAVPRDETKISMPSAVVEFLHFVKKEDADQTLLKLQKMKKGFVRKIPLNEMTAVVHLLIKTEKIFDLSCCVQAMSYILDNVDEILKPLLEKYSNSGDIGSLNRIGKVVPDFALIKCSFNDYLTKAYISSEKYEDLILELERRWNAKNKLFSIPAFQELLKRPELEERVVNLAKKYLECNFDLPLAVVWAHCLVNSNFEKANELFKTYSIPADKVDMMVLKAVSQQGNIRAGQLYISAVNHLNARSRCKERAYGTLLDILVSKGRCDDAVALITEAKGNNLCVEKHYKSTLIKLKNALEGDRKEVPFTIPSEVL
ncbi:hypothetical protein AVEN_73564-1 [Araneus ventricosus]|uniref:Pentatricopeptide repeat-containing protein 2, mitochondrial n=1 Tax=Araneus ventricosus TaxID=182803 RepID=A0A4Y2L662_ARAVE|nr:hypothetical protein AVEN_73564-1 [Araneus ventricosus]